MVALQRVWHTGMMVNTPTMQLLASYFDRQASTGLSKHMVLRGRILHMIEERHWQTSDPIPSEQEFTRIIDISLGLVQKLLRLLADDGVLSHQHGRGTFLQADSTRLNTPHHFRFVDDDNQTRPPVDIDVIRNAPSTTKNIFPLQSIDV